MKLDKSYPVGRRCEKVDYYKGDLGKMESLDFVGLGFKVNGLALSVEFYGEKKDVNYRNIYCEDCEYYNDSSYYEHTKNQNVYCECPETFTYKSNPIKKDIVKQQVIVLNAENNCRFFKKKEIKKKKSLLRYIPMMGD